jgi:hypothetical protein
VGGGGIFVSSPGAHMRHIVEWVKERYMWVLICSWD